MIGDPMSPVCQRLLSWHTVALRCTQLQRVIANQEQRVAQLKNLTRRNRSTSEREKVRELEIRLTELRIEWVELCIQLDEVESELAILSPRKQAVVRRYYRDRAPWQKICSEMFISKARLYQLLHNALDELKRQHRDPAVTSYVLSDQIAEQQPGYT